MTTVQRPPKVPRPVPVPRVRSALIERLAAEDVEMFWSRIADRLPLVEDDGGSEVTVTFCWRDTAAAPAEQVLLFANRLTDETSLPETLLERMPGTDLWHASFRMGRDWRASYSFLVQPVGGRAPWLVDGHVALRAALDRGLPDPRNPDTCINRAGVTQSVASMPDAPAQPWLLPLPEGAARGTVDAVGGPDGRDVWLYRPAGAPGGESVGRLPLIVALDGEVWVRWLPTILDTLVAAGEIPPVYAVLPSSGGRDARWAELGAGGGGADWVAECLLPWTAERVPFDLDRVVLAGQSLGGLTALRAGLSRPDVISAVVSHSASLWQDDLAELVRPGIGTRIHLAHGTQEWVLDGPHREVADRLRAAGLEVDVATYNGGHDYACWRGGLGEGIRWVLGPWSQP